MEIYLSLLVVLIGGLVHLVSSNSRLSELGRIAFACGLLAFLLGPAASRLFSVLSR